jgi:hypothetical protein
MLNSGMRVTAENIERLSYWAYASARHEEIYLLALDGRIFAASLTAYEARFRKTHVVIVTVTQLRALADRMGLEWTQQASGLKILRGRSAEVMAEHLNEQKWLVEPWLAE